MSNRSLILLIISLFCLGFFVHIAKAEPYEKPIGTYTISTCDDKRYVKDVFVTTREFSEESNSPLKDIVQKFYHEKSSGMEGVRTLIYEFHKTGGVRLLIILTGHVCGPPETIYPY